MTQCFNLILLILCEWFEFQYLFLLYLKFWFQPTSLLNEEILIWNFFNYKNCFKNYHFINYNFPPSFTLQNLSELSFLLFGTFFINKIDWCNFNQIFNFGWQKSTNLFSQIKCYGEWIVYIYKIIYINMIKMRKTFKQQKKFIKTRQKCNRGKCITSKKFVFIT